MEFTILQISQGNKVKYQLTIRTAIDRRVIDVLEYRRKADMLRDMMNFAKNHLRGLK